MVETVKKTGPVVPRMLVHMCCGPCSIIPLKQVLTDSYEVIGFFYNPNIHPYTEFKKRLLAVKTLAGYLSVGLVCDEEYRPTAFVKGMKASIPGAPRFPPKLQRCLFCYSTRLEKTAVTAAANGFDAFTSSLLYSRYQDHDLIRKLGVDLGRKYGILFYYEDFRTGWQEGIDASKKIGLYRQKYCGCAYSKIERFAGKKHSVKQSAT